MATHMVGLNLTPACALTRTYERAPVAESLLRTSEIAGISLYYEISPDVGPMRKCAHLKDDGAPYGQIGNGDMRYHT